MCGTFRYLALGAILCLLAACGGGSGTTGGPTTTPGPEPAAAPEPVFDTPEYRRNYGLDSVNALEAYEAGLSGEGVTVGVIDTGVDLDHPDLDANISSDSISIHSRAYADAQDEDGHGTGVAGVIAAERNGRDTHGVAFDSEILAVRAEATDSCSGEDVCTFNSSDVADGIDYAVAHGAEVINLSMGSDSGPSFALTRAIRDAVNAGTAIVISAGNDKLEMPSAFARFATDPTVKGNILIAGAVDRNNAFANFSNKAGGPTTQDVYVVAPGVSIETTYLDAAQGQTVIYDGTSFSAPHVSGMLAVLMENFPNLSTAEIIDIVLDTARDLGASGPDATFGHGLVDLAAAIAPTGSLSVETADGATASLDGGLRPGTAMGDSLESAFAGALAFDERDRAYKAFLGQRVASAPEGFRLSTAARELRYAASSLHFGRQSLRVGIARRRTEVLSAPTPLERQAFRSDVTPSVDYTARVSGRLSLRFVSGSIADSISPLAPAFAETALTWKSPNPAAQVTGQGQKGMMAYRVGPATRIGAAVYTGDRTLGREFGDLVQSGGALHIAHRFGDSAALGIEAGRLEESGSLLGLTGTGVFDAIDGATTDYVQLDARLRAGNWHLYGTAAVSRSRADLAKGGILTGFSDVTATSRSLVIRNDRFADSGHILGLSVTQPLAVISGHGTATLATGWADGTPATEARRIDLRPEARETALELFHRWDGPGASEIGTHFIYRDHPDNIADTPDETAVFVRLRTSL